MGAGWDMEWMLNGHAPVDVTAARGGRSLERFFGGGSTTAQANVRLSRVVSPPTIAGMAWSAWNVTFCSRLGQAAAFAPLRARSTARRLRYAVICAALAGVLAARPLGAKPQQREKVRQIHKPFGWSTLSGTSS